MDTTDDNSNGFTGPENHSEAPELPGCGPGGRGFESRRSPLNNPLQAGDFALDHNLPESPTGTDSGTDAHTTTTGTTADSGGAEPPIRFRGDEPELYLAFNPELVKLIEHDVRAAPEDIEDACSFAWIQFFRYQPDRERN